MGQMNGPNAQEDWLFTPSPLVRPHGRLLGLFSVKLLTGPLHCYFVLVYEFHGRSRRTPGVRTSRKVDRQISTTAIAAVALGDVLSRRLSQASMVMSVAVHSATKERDRGEDCRAVSQQNDGLSPDLNVTIRMRGNGRLASPPRCDGLLFSWYVLEMCSRGLMRQT